MPAAAGAGRGSVGGGEVVAVHVSKSSRDMTTPWRPEFVTSAWSVTVGPRRPRPGSVRHGLPWGRVSHSPSADVSVRIAWADDADAIAAVQVRAWRGCTPTWSPPARCPPTRRAGPRVARVAGPPRGRPPPGAGGPGAQPGRRLRPDRPGRRPRRRPGGRRHARRAHRGPRRARQGPRITAAAGGRRHPRRRPVHPRRHLGAGPRRRAARLPHRGRLGAGRRPPRAGPRRSGQTTVKQVRLHTAIG